MRVILKYLIFGSVIAVITYFFIEKNIIKVQSSYEDCVINNVKDVKDKSAINVIKSMCEKKYNKENTLQKLDKDKIKNQLNEVLDLFKDFQKQFEEKMK